jgi:hypothetical protein
VPVLVCVCERGEWVRLSSAPVLIFMSVSVSISESVCALRSRNMQTVTGSTHRVTGVVVAPTCAAAADPARPGPIVAGLQGQQDGTVRKICAEGVGMSCSSCAHVKMQAARSSNDHGDATHAHEGVHTHEYVFARGYMWGILAPRV